MRRTTKLAKTIINRIAAHDWLPETLDEEERSLVSEIGERLNWNAELTGAFCVALLDDVNMHSEAARVNALLSDWSRDDSPDDM